MQRRSGTRTGLIVIVLAGGLTLWLGGCPITDTTGGNTTPTVAGLQVFASSDELLTYVKEQARERVSAQQRDSYWNFFSLGGAAAPTAMEEGATASDDSGDGASPGYSQTNLQEAGVDEADIFKSDGTNFYIADDSTLRIVQADPLAGLAQVAEIQVGDDIQDLYIYGDSIIVIGYRYMDVDPNDYPYPMPRWGYGWGWYGVQRLQVSQIDVSDPASPVQTHQLEIDGSLVDSRLADGRLVIISSVTPELPTDTYEIQELTLDSIMPAVTTSSGDAPAVSWAQWYYPNDRDGVFTTTVMTLDAANVESVIGSLAIIGDAGTIYMSPEALYLTDDEVAADDLYRPVTAIHKITFDAGGVPQYAASGSVPGRLNNQFSLSENEGYLRVATHVEEYGMFIEPWFGDVVIGIAVSNAEAQMRTPTEPFNAVYVLGQAGDTLKVIGLIDNIAPGEDIYAVRFMGDHGFVVTFEQIDPLFVMDLTDPTDPTIAGNLKIPGFSEYLHPWGDNYLIGVGQSTAESRWGGTITDGIQLSLFDVSDWSDPQVVQQVTIGEQGSYSDVSSTHKAFTFLPESGLLALPGQVTSGTAAYGWPTEYSSVVVLVSVDAATGFTELGRLDMIAERQGDYSEYYYGPYWRRAAFIGDALYAVSDAGVNAAPIADLAQTISVQFPMPEDYEPWGGVYPEEDTGEGVTSSPGTAGAPDDE
ncbi:MAG: beta-propeller domain-containing protein [Phycisphaerae bacterium]|nr:beta-propeller domain-containing protein [Phycisphaerae bacterium]